MGKIKHGLSHSRINQIWRDMKQRCNNPKCCNYKHYGARSNDLIEAVKMRNDFIIKNGLDNKLNEVIEC